MRNLLCYTRNIPHCVIFVDYNNDTNKLDNAILVYNTPTKYVRKK